MQGNGLGAEQATTMHRSGAGSHSNAPFARQCTNGARSMLKHRVRRAAAGSAVLALCLAGCAPERPAAQPAVNERRRWTLPGTLRIGTADVPRTLNPLLSTQPFEAVLDRLFADVLVTVDARGNFVPDLAAEVPTAGNGGISADGLTIRYKLRDRVRWQDGRPFTSRDVKFTYEAVMNPANDIVSRHGYDVVSRVDTPDARTVIFHLKHRFAPFVATVFGESDGPFCILPAHLLAGRTTINDGPYNALPVGTGPFSRPLAARKPARAHAQRRLFSRQAEAPHDRRQIHRR